MTQYGVKIVADDDLGDQDWMFVVTDHGPVFVVTQSACQSERSLSEAWAAWRTIDAHPHLIPAGERHLQAV